jgi:3-isopropylmalate/(R)-2-methylmalate dehydratase small subunit|tara:strand:- start:18 stop:611 length:594 start_codon:yes stop_codon:yes gene_type:complete
MEKYTKTNGKVLPMNRANIDTDQIIPAKYLKRVERTGFGQYLFDAWRKMPDGTPNPNFILNDKRYEGATILVAGANFGSGSSREHAPWALNDYGFRTILAPSFADIFRSNCFQNGMLPIALDQKILNKIIKKSLDNPNYSLTVDLESSVISDSDELTIEFSIDNFKKHCLLEGLDDIGLTMAEEFMIKNYESRHVIT